MRKLVPILLLVVIFAGCADDRKQKAYVSVKDFSTYVDSVQNAKAEYTDDYWTNADAEYQRRRSAVESYNNELDEESRKAYDEAVKNWEDYKSRYEAERDKAVNDMNNMNGNMSSGNGTGTGTSNMMDLRVGLFGQGYSDNLGSVNAGNVANVYHHFVEYVDQAEEDFSKEQWNEIQRLWEKLDARRESFEKDISIKDKLNIKEEKTRYATLKVGTKPFSESENK